MTEFMLVSTEQQMELVEKLAREIFHEHYDTYMDPNHVEFYLEKYQTAKVIEKQLKKNFEYHLIVSNKKTVGYLALEQLKDSLRISKLYILKEYRNKKFGADAMGFAENIARKMQYPEIDLYVNERNNKGSRFYKSIGFEECGCMTHSYENGHTEVDILMAKAI